MGHSRLHALTQPVLRLNHNSSSCQSQGRTGCLLLLLEQYVKTQRATHLLPLSPRTPSLSHFIMLFFFFHHFFHHFFSLFLFFFPLLVLQRRRWVFHLLIYWMPRFKQRVCVYEHVCLHTCCFMCTRVTADMVHTQTGCVRDVSNFCIVRESDCPFYLYVYILHFFLFLNNHTDCMVNNLWL